MSKFSIAALTGLTLTLAAIGASSAYADSSTRANWSSHMRGFGQMMQSGSKNSGVFGTVTGINGSTISVSAFAPRFSAGQNQPTTFTVDGANAKIQKNGAGASLSDISIGDKISVIGTVSGTNIAATDIRDAMARGPKIAGSLKISPALPITGNGLPVVGGDITGISGNSLTVTNAGGATYTVDVTNARIVVAGATSTITDLRKGEHVIVQGNVNGDSVSATSVVLQGARQVAAEGTARPQSSGFFGFMRGFFGRIFGF